MQRAAKRILAGIVSLSMILALGACGNSKETGKATEVSYGQVWSAPSTVKVRQDEIDYENKDEAVLSYQAVRNEYESCQLLITAKKAVEHFELQVSDLKNGDEVLSKENIAVYVEKFIPYSSLTENGYMADALIPMETADKYKENTIQAGANGGLWVTIYIPEKTTAGLYEGTFELVMSGEKGEEKLDVPVSVNVFDYTLPKEQTARTLFSWRYDRVAVGELDGSLEMMTYYYEFFQDYRISLQSLPLDTLSGEEYAEMVLKYYDETTAYGILTDAGDISGDLLRHEDKVREQIFAIAAISAPGKNLLDKAMIYFMDEPNLTIDASRETVITNMGKMDAILQRCVDTIKADDTGAYDNFKKIENWEETILDIPNIIPLNTTEWMLKNEHTKEAQELMKALDCICPKFSTFTEGYTEKLVALCEKYDIKLWWYGATNPRYPAATYHISDKNLLSARTISWLQSKFNVAGNLYWDAAAYTNEASDGYNQYVNVYEFPYRSTTMEWPAGDGFLTYPGAAYGVYGPLPSMRLMSIRDGMEEYEILQMLSVDLEEQTSTFGTGFSSEEAMNSLYNAVAYDPNNMYSDGENGLNFTKLRRELIELAIGVNDGLGFVIGEKNVQGDKATFTYYVQNGSKVSIDGEEQKPISENAYQYEMDLSKSTEIKVTVTNTNGKTVCYDRFIAEPIYEVNSLSDATVMENIQVTDESTVEFVSNDTYSTDGTAVHFNINGVLTGNDLVDSTFTPSASIGTSLFKVQPEELSNIRMDLYNPGDTFAVKLKLYSGSSYVELGDYEVATGKVSLNIDLNAQQFNQIDTADRITFEFVNTQEEQVMSYEFYLDNIVGEK